ncbi:MAG TPA: SprT family zinc-dependent metalloprotease [Candidatus Saccharimonadales bacterium]|nr:SprT family zinc-dependent metalloprotease [Candidatus Saccharimonadales bacterium]
MAFKQFTLSDGTLLTIYKRKASRGLRLSVTPEGSARVSIPRWSAYAAGQRFAESRLEWIKAQQRPAAALVNGQRIGKAHRLRLVAKPNEGKVAARVGKTEAIVTYPPQLDAAGPAVQDAARRAGIRALRAEAESLLPQRLAALAGRHGFTYNQVTIKQMKSRWGSCDRHRNIVLNLFLMQLPWEQIDYVLLHELTHTEVLRHGPDFWRAMERVQPASKQLRQAVRTAQPLLHGASQVVA